MGFLHWLALLFVALRLCGVIDWPWPLVLSPILVPLALSLAALFAAWAADRARKRKWK